MRGPGPIEGDVEFMGMKASGFERALLENLAAAKGALAGRAMSREGIEARLEDVLRIKGEESLVGDHALARSQGSAFDPKCFNRLEILFAHLRHLPLKEIKDTHRSPGTLITKPSLNPISQIISKAQFLRLKKLKVLFLITEFLKQDRQMPMIF